MMTVFVLKSWHCNMMTVFVLKSWHCNMMTVFVQFTLLTIKVVCSSTPDISTIAPYNIETQNHWGFYSGIIATIVTPIMIFLQSLGWRVGDSH